MSATIEQLKRLKDLPPAKRALFMQMMQKQAALAESAHRIPRRPAGDSAPLSFAQQRLWLMDQLMPGASLYNIPVAVRLTGALDAAAMEACLTEVVRRHESLRTTCGVVNGEPRQVIAPPHPFELPFFDLRECVEGEKESEMRRLIAAEAGTAFDLTRGPLVRASLLRLAAEEHVLVLTMHHIVSDGWSRGVLIREVTQLYAAFATGQPSPLPELPVQFADFAVWQRARLTDAAIEAQLAYWKQQLGGTLPVLELPADRPRPPVQTYRGATLMFLIPRRTTEDLRRLAREEEATLFMALLAVFQLLLRRYTGQQDISVGTPVAGRDRTELEGLIGLFVNTLVMRTDLSGDPTFRQLLGRTRETALGAFSNQDVQFERLVEELRPERDMSRTPLFQAMFMLQNAPPSGISELRGLSVEPLQIASVTAKFDVTFSFGETDDGLRGTLEYSSDLFDHATMERFAAHFQRLAEEAATHPGEKISALRMLAPAERLQLLEEFNDTRRDYAPDLTLADMFEQQVARTPARIALVAGDEQLTYAELNARAERLAAHLRQLGVGSESLVAVCAERSARLVTALLGVLKAGGAYVPLDPNYPAERLAYMLEDSRAGVLLTERHLEGRLPEHDATVVHLDEPRWKENAPDAAAMSHAAAPHAARRAGAANLAYVIYTSGSTGRPKGVAITHGSASTLLHWSHDFFSADELSGVLCSTSVCFDLSIFELFVPLTCGGRVILAADALHLPELAAAGEVTLINTVPSALTELLRLGAVPDAVRVVNLAGEALRRSLVDDLYAQSPQVGRVLNLYGPTEDTTYSTWREVARHVAREPEIGRGLANTRLYVLDAGLLPVPTGVRGELYIAGEGLARGYLNRPELTAERFIPDPLAGEPGARMYRTGDVVRWRADGEMEYFGRADHQVKVRGFRIELGEIEVALGAQAGVRESVVVVREDARGEKQLVAYVVAEAAAELRGGELRASLRERLPEYMLPSAFVLLDELPLTPNGKVDRRALPAPDASRFAAGQPFVAPQTPTEEMLANIWCDVLGVARVGVGDNFFDLGGHSLLATQVMSRVRAAFSKELPLRTLFDSPTVASLALALSPMPGGEASPQRPQLRHVETTGARPLSFAQQRLWFLDQLTPGSAAYNVPVALRLRGELDVAALAGALSEVERRHEALRTKFVKIDGLPAQVVGEATDALLVRDDLSRLPAEMRAAEARRLASEEARLPFDLVQGPVWRARLLRLSEDDHVLLVTLHHIVSDAWSLGVIVRELSSLYRAFAAGEESGLEELQLQYADYAEWQRGWLQGGALEEQLSFWRTQLAGSDDVLQLPADRQHPPTRSFLGARHEFRVSAESSARLRNVSRREGATLFMTLLAAWQALLARYSGQEQISVGTPIAGRAQLETEALVGFFVNTLVLRTDLSGEPSFGQLLRRVREVCLGAFNHQDVPFEKLVEELQPERSMSHSPLFQVMFSLQNAPIGALDMPGLTLSEMSPEGEGMMEKFDLTLTMHESGDSIGGTFSYSTDLFDHATIERMAEHFIRLLEEAALAPERLVSELELSSGAERRRLLVGWNDTRADYARDRVLHELFEEQVERTPAAIAVVSRNESLTYAELDGRANQLAHHLRGLGVGAESLVAVCAERSVEMVVGLLGVLKAGGAYVPLDPAYPMERLGYMLSDARAAVLLTQERLLEKLSGVAARVVSLDADWETIAGESVASPRVQVGAENPAYVIYTSGSTGRPKGVVISHSAICNHMAWMQAALPLDASDAVLQKTPFSFDASVWEFYAPLLAGARLVMAEPGGHQDASYLLKVVEAERITILQTVPSLLRMLLAETALRRCVTLRRLFCGGEPLTRELQERLYEQLDAVTLYNLYGPTEATIDAGAWECERGSERRVVPIGRPISNAQMYVLDKHRQPVPQGTVGELYIGGAGLARGYLHRPDLTAQKFVPHPFSEEPGARLYQTGDLARHLPDGALEFLGRADHQVKVRGFRIELGEIEAALNELETVRECVVTAREDAPGEKRLVAYTVAGAGGMPPGSELRELLRAKLPEHMIPTLFVELDELPLTPNGKLDRGALPVPERAGSEAGRNFVAPRTAVEESVAELWAESLGIERVGVHDNFFDVGGHSLVAALLIARLRDAFQIDIPLSVFFNTTPTVERMSEAIEMLLIEGASDGEVEKLLAELDGLSDDEVKAVLMGGDGHAESNTEGL